MSKKWPILLVDDHANTRALLRKILQSVGFKSIIEASCGEEALDRMRLTPIRTVICDYHMQEMDGLTLHRRMLENPALSETPFILISADDDFSLTVAAARAHVDLLIKPFPPETLLKSVARAIGEPALA
jgi:two-component system chemotaxis response regulator CheY